MASAVNSLLVGQRNDKTAWVFDDLAKCIARNPDKAGRGSWFPTLRKMRAKDGARGVLGDYLPLRSFGERSFHWCDDIVSV